MFCFTVLESKSMRSKYWEDHDVLSEISKDDSCTSCNFCWFFGNARQSPTHSCSPSVSASVILHGLLSCVCVSSPLMRIWVIGFIKKKKNNNFTYLFICGCAGSLLPCWLFSSFREQGLLSGCVAQASHCGGFFCSRAWALECTGFHCCSSIALECKLSSCGARA